mgnify:FL=1
MNCYDTRNNNTNTNTTTNTNGIADLLRRLDKMQRDAVIANEADTCENCMLTSMYNTKPIAIFSNCGRLACPLGATSEDTANLFRVEAVRGNETVVLRLLQNTNGVITCTTYTVVVRIACICCVQCFDPINCETTCYPVVG